jgi:hypothetical protein
MKQDLVIRVVMLGVRTEKKQMASMVEIQPASFPLGTEQKAYQCAECVYSTAVELDWFKHQQSPVHAAYDLELSKLEGCLSLIIPYPFTPIVVHSTVDGQKIGPRPEPKDMSYKRLYEVADLFPPVYRRPRFSLLVTKDAATVLDSYLRALRKHPSPRIYQLLLALRWFSKGTGESNPYDRFMSFWIAFNVLYSKYRSPGDSEQSGIECCVGNLFRPKMARRYHASYQNYIQELTAMKLVLGRKGSKQVSADLSALLSARPLNYLEIINKVALGLYAIRCHLFHGDYRFGDEEHTRAVSVGEILLCELLRHLLALLILRRQLPTTKTVRGTSTPLL